MSEVDFPANDGPEPNRIQLFLMPDLKMQVSLLILPGDFLFYLAVFVAAVIWR